MIDAIMNTLNKTCQHREHREQGHKNQPVLGKESQKILYPYHLAIDKFSKRNTYIYFCTRNTSLRQKHFVSRK